MLADPADHAHFPADYLNDKDDGLRAAAAEGWARLRIPRISRLWTKPSRPSTIRMPASPMAFALVSLGESPDERITARCSIW